MEHTGPSSPYEVYCYNCHVTAPVGTRRCVHCGERLSGKGHVASDALPVSFDGEVTVEGPSASRISPMTVVWVVLAIGITLQRMCN